MDPAYITPFISAVQNVFSTMMQLPVTVGAPTVRNSPSPTYDVSGIIGMSGDVSGNIVLSFPQASALRLVQLFTGTQMAVDSADFADAIGELTNMISGNAKGQFAGKRKVQISCPSVVVGSGHTVARPREVPVIAIPCSSDCGEFVMEIAIQERPAGSAGATTNAAAAKATA